MIRIRIRDLDYRRAACTIPTAMQIRPLASVDEFRAAERFQEEVWSFDPREVTPLSELVTAAREGGLVLGAFDPAGRMVGLVYGWVGRRAGKFYHFSRLAGVAADQRDSGLGMQLKLEQRRWALDQGFDLICWTFDPLQSRNAHFNLMKLGAICREYLVNLYGQNNSRFNRGLETDRFLAEWWIASPRVLRRVGGQIPEPAGEREVEIPAQIDAVRERDLEEARGWRERTRAELVDALGKGYVVTGLARRQGRSFLTLQKKPLETILA
jgi:predicted GNAT superfamily acetyltransferase